MRRQTVQVCAVAAGFGAAYALYGLFRHWHFASGYDLAIFDQAVWHMSRGAAPASTISGHANILGDHFYPILALFAPLYWIASRPETLIIAQAALVALSIVPVFLFARSRLAPGPAMALAIAYACYWGLQRAVAFDVHEMAFAPLAIAIAILAMDQRRWRLFSGAAVAVILIKEDLIPLIGAFGVYLFVEGDRRRGVVLMAAGAAIFAIVTAVVIPAFNDVHNYNYASGAGELAAHPWRIPVALVTPPTKVRTAVLWFAPFAFVSLASPLSLLAAPFALARFLSATPTHWGTTFHYSAPLAPIVAMSAADGLSRIAKRVGAARGDRAARRVTLVVAAMSVLLSALLPGRQPLWRVFSPSHYRGTPATSMGHAIVALVPRDASIVAQAAVLPHLSQRPSIFILDDTGRDADYFVAAEAFSPWPGQSVEDVRRWVELRKARGYDVVKTGEGWTLLRRPAR